MLFRSDAATTAEDTPVTIDVLGNDADVPPAAAVQLVDTPTHGTAVLNADATFTYAPAADFHGTDSFTYRIDDGQGVSNLATVTLTVSPVNDAPVVAAPIADQTSPEDTAWTYTIPAGTFADVDGDALTLSATLAGGASLPTWLTFDAATRTFSGTPPADFNGSLALAVTATEKLPTQAPGT